MLVVGNKFALGSFTSIEEKYVVASASCFFFLFVPSLVSRACPLVAKCTGLTTRRRAKSRRNRCDNVCFE